MYIGSHFPTIAANAKKGPEVLTRRTLIASGYTVVDIASSSGVATPGGTASNVSEVTRALGWSTMLVGKLGNDPAGRYIKAGLRGNGVDTTALHLDDAWMTPVLLHEVHGGQPIWRFRCPHCGTAFAKHRPAGVSDADALLAATARPDVFFFDRATLFALRLAEAWSELGTLVYFEPSGLGRPQLFTRSAMVADVIKFSSDRAAAFRTQLEGSNAVVIETLGSSGVRVRATANARTLDVPSLRAPSVVDSAGAGDWFTAGFLQGLASEGDLVAALGNDRVLKEAVVSGQRLGALACSWIGARPPSWSLPSRPQTIDQRFFCPLLVKRP